MNISASPPPGVNSQIVVFYQTPRRRSSCGTARRRRTASSCVHLQPCSPMDEHRRRTACAACQSPASVLTGLQTPVDSTPTCPSITQATGCLGNPGALAACLSVKTNFVLHFSGSLLIHPLIQEFMCAAACLSNLTLSS